MYHDFLGPRRLQGTHMNTLKPKKFKIDNIHCEKGVSLHFGQSWPIVCPGTPGTPRDDTPDYTSSAGRKSCRGNPLFSKVVPNAHHDHN